MPVATHEHRLRKTGEVEEALGHCVVLVHPGGEGDPTLVGETERCRRGVVPHDPDEGHCGRQPAVALLLTAVGGGDRRHLGLAGLAPAGEEEEDRRSAVPSAIGRHPDRAPPPNFGRVNDGTWSPATGRPPDLPVPTPVKSPMPRATASTIPTARKMGRARRPSAAGDRAGGVGIGRPVRAARGRVASARGSTCSGHPPLAQRGAGRRGPRPGARLPARVLPARCRTSAVADQDVSGHGHEQQREVRDRVAEEPHGSS